jgi:hypothetical protein
MHQRQAINSPLHKGGGHESKEGLKAIVRETHTPERPARTALPITSMEHIVEHIDQPVDQR